jgi:hypothetical protein
MIIRNRQNQPIRTLLYTLLIHMATILHLDICTLILLTTKLPRIIQRHQNPLIRRTMADLAAVVATVVERAMEHILAVPKPMDPLQQEDCGQLHQRQVDTVAVLLLEPTSQHINLPMLVHGEHRLVNGLSLVKE